MKTLVLSLLSIAVVHAGPETWKQAVKHPVAPAEERHSIHAYFNTCPESPDGKFVLYYSSGTADGETGDLRILERASGEETIVAGSITTEDAHRAACQQWSDGGKFIVYHNYQDGHWSVRAIERETKKEKLLAMDRQLGFGAVNGQWIPVYGCHWNPGPHRNLELVNVETGEVKTPVTAEQVVGEYGDWIAKKFGSTGISIFFPVMSPDGTKVFFKLSKPGGGSDFRSKAASVREGKVIYDLAAGKFIRLVEQWGHPSWTPDSTGIFEKSNFVMEVATGKTQPRYSPSCFSDHPSLSPAGDVFVTDADVTKRTFGKPGFWAIGIGSTTKDEFVVVDLFDNAAGAKSWRHNHPHPAFSADGKRIYYNVNEGPWTRLKVAEIP